MSGLIRPLHCASYAVKDYKHKDNGIGNNTNPIFVQDRDECNNSIYANGVISEGKRITNPEEIEKLQTEYNNWLVKSFTEDHKKMYAGARRTPIPEKYADLDQRRAEMGPCLADKGWRKN